MSLSYCTLYPLYYICFLLFLSFPSDQTLSLPCYGTPRWSQGPGHRLDHSLTHWVAKPLQRNLGGSSLWVSDRQGGDHNRTHRSSRVKACENQVCKELTICMLSHSVMSDSLWPHGLYSPGSSVCGISRQEYWSGLPLPTLGIFPNQGLNPCLPQLLHGQADSLPLNYLGSPWN